MPRDRRADDPFIAYHRATRRAVLSRGLLSSILVLAVAAGLVGMAGAAEPATPAAAATAPVGSIAQALPMEAAVLPTEAAVLPTGTAPLPAGSDTPSDVVSPAAPVSVPEPVPAGPKSWSITIDTVGYQAEIDRCLWVRMELRADAPIVGAHNNCGGSVVLEMLVGDTVTLTGTGLDGRYVVAAERDGQAGANAAAATAGFGADVILQTCYWNSGGRERLLALIRMP